MPWVPISEARVSPMEAKQIRLMCPHCHGFVYVDIPWRAPENVPYETMRQRLVQEAVEDHRKVCTGADMIEGRVYTIEYPRA